MPKRKASQKKEAPKRRKKNAHDKALVVAARNGDTTAVQEGLEKRAPDTECKKVAFAAALEACKGNHDECLALLLPFFETTQMGFGMLLSECVHADRTACTEVLLQHWKSVCSSVAFVPYNGETPLPCPAMWADPAVCQALIAAGADIETRDEMGRMPLHWSCKSGALTVVKMLVEAGANVCGVTKYRQGGLTCLQEAAHNGHTEIVRYLVGLKEVDVNAAENKKGTSLHLAAGRKFPDVVQVLIDAGADIEAKNKKGRTPLHLASVGGDNLATVQMLVKAGANVSEVDGEGNRCLSIACPFGRTETVRYLVGLKEVDVNHRNLLGHTALDHAKEHQRADVEQVLLDVFAQ